MDDDILIILVFLIFMAVAGFIFYEMYMKNAAVTVPSTTTIPSAPSPSPAPSPAPAPATDMSTAILPSVNRNSASLVGGKGLQYAIYRPQLESIYANIGDIFVPGSDITFSTPQSIIVVSVPADNPNQYSYAPSGYTLIDYDQDANLSFWWPTAPSGSKAMGMVVTVGTSPPAPGVVRCLRNEYIKQSSIVGSPIQSNLHGGISAWRILGAHCFTLGTTKPTYNVYAPLYNNIG